MSAAQARALAHELAAEVSLAVLEGHRSLDDVEEDMAARILEAAPDRLGTIDRIGRWFCGRDE